jgi:hypothetical protein
MILHVFAEWTSNTISPFLKVQRKFRHDISQPTVGSKMSDKKISVKNILEVKARSRHQQASIELIHRLHELQSSYKKIDKNNLELLKYFPVAIVACVEAYFKMAIKELVDKRKDLMLNAIQHVKQRFDIETAVSLNGNEITLGDLVAHSCSYSKFDSIESSVSKILNKSFAVELRSVQNTYRNTFYDEPLQPILENPEKTFESVRKIYELRHIICHEIASSHVFNYDEINESFEDCVQFLRASDEVISNTIEPNFPRTQAELSEKAIEDLTTVSMELNNLNDEIINALEPMQVDEFNKMHAEWLGYAEAWAEFESGYFENGSLRFTTRNYIFVRMYEERIAMLKNYKSFLLDI